MKSQIEIGSNIFQKKIKKISVKHKLVPYDLTISAPN
jgi:hypothetical protein